MKPPVDMLSKKCTRCKRGHYKETSVHDDWDGKLHCPKCDHEISRWKYEDKK